MFTAFLTNPDYANLVHHLPALIIVVPLMLAPLCVILRGRNLSWSITVLSNLICLLIAYLLLLQVKDGSVIRYALGGWAAPSGIEYYIDKTNAIVLLLIT